MVTALLHNKTGDLRRKADYKMKIGFIDYYLDEWHANNYPKMLHDATDGEITVAYAYGDITSPLSGMTTGEWCAKFGIGQCKTIEELVEKSDGIIVLSPDNSEQHERLSEIPLKSGKPTYIDKTFTTDTQQAKRIFALAEKHNTPCWSTSALRYADEYKDIPEITKLASWGPNELDTYSIHQLEPMIMLMKGQPDRALYHEDSAGYTLTVDFEDGRCATVSGWFRGYPPFMMSLGTTEGHKMITVKSKYFNNFIVQLADFFKTKEAKVPHCETVKIVSVLEAALASRKAGGEWVKIARP